MHNLMAVIICVRIGKNLLCHINPWSKCGLEMSISFHSWVIIYSQYYESSFVQNFCNNTIVSPNCFGQEFSG